MMRKLGKLWIWIVYAFLFLPIFVVIAYSFNAAKYTSAWKGFTLKWYSQLFGNAALIDAVVNTLSVAALAASLATLLGVLAALCLKRTEFPGRQLLHASLYVLTVSPEMVMGISLLIFFISVKLPLGFVSMLIAHTTLGLPFVALTVLARLAEFDEHLVEAARDLGATEAQAFRYVILPVIMPAVVAGWLLAFTLSMDDVLISFFVAGPTFEVLPLRIYSMVRLGVKPDIMTSAKALGCGVPVGAFMMTEKVAQHSLTAGDHGTTYGGNPFVCAAVSKVFDLFEEDHIIEHVREVAPYLEQRLNELADKYDCIKERRGVGLMQGLVFDHPVGDIINRALEKGLILINAGADIIRFVPPLVITRENVDEMIAILDTCIE